MLGLVGAALAGQRGSATLRWRPVRCRCAAAVLRIMPCCSGHAALPGATLLTSP